MEAQISEHQAVELAWAFAVSKGAVVASCGGVSHAAEIEHGTYIVTLCSDTCVQDNRDWQTGELLPDIVMWVIVNDQTGKAEQFERLL